MSTVVRREEELLHRSLDVLPRTIEMPVELVLHVRGDAAARLGCIDEAFGFLQRQEGLVDSLIVSLHDPHDIAERDRAGHGESGNGAADETASGCAERVIMNSFPLSSWEDTDRALPRHYSDA